MDYDAMYYPYPSKRVAVYGRKGMVATSQPLAAQAGLDVLKKGGNAVDAAIAAAACLTVVEPTSNGIGGDAFALVWMKGKLYGLNSSGPSPKGITLEAVKSAGYKEMPELGWMPVNVPGIPAAWGELSKRFGRLTLTQDLKQAVEYAENGYPVAPVTSRNWHKAFQRFSRELKEDKYKYLFETFAPDGRTPAAGEMWRSAGHARTLRLIAETNAEAFYRGELAELIDSFSKETGGFIRGEDLADFAPEWVQPININYRGYNVWEIPPNGHGLVALMALNILKGFDFDGRDAADTSHKQIEAIKLAFADGKKYITDPQKMKMKVEDLLSEAYADERRRLIGKEALLPEAGKPSGGGTVYLAAADGDGNMVSYIQSNYKGFGSGLVVPGTGIALHNRGCNFSLDLSHDNVLEPGKRPYHTIIPGFLSKGENAVGPFGVMGAFMQPQGHVQVVMNTIDFGLNPQAALDAPRWQWVDGKTVAVESHFPVHIAETLSRMGHDVKVYLDPSSFGRGQIIWKDANGVLTGGTEPRTDGMVAVW
jgi:gamma-glutamyltranspeptidase/glutathione hydrolase